jgi:hypothetical protein
LLTFLGYNLTALLRADEYEAKNDVSLFHEVRLYVLSVFLSMILPSKVKFGRRHSYSCSKSSAAFWMQSAFSCSNGRPSDTLKPLA